MRRFASCALAAAAATALGVAGAAASREGVRPPSGAELQALAQPPVHTSFASQRIYFVMPDRYANGDPANDRGGAAGGRDVTGFDPTDAGWYHGGDLKGLTGTCTDPRTGLARLAELGFTAVWVTPVVRQKAVQADSAAYHGYWGLDFTSVDPHLGTDEDFAAFVGCAHRLGLKVYLDVVVNHTADVISPAGGSTFRGPDQVPYRDCRGRPFSAQRYAGGTTFPCLSPSYQPRRPLVAERERGLKRPAWLNQVVRYHNRGNIDFGSCSAVCLEQGDFFGLDDLFTEQPFVVSGLARIYGAWISRYRLDGFRVDTAKHVDRAFFRSWVPKIRAAARAAGIPEFELFGEVFTTDAVELSSFVRERGLPNVIDFPLQDALVRYAGGSAGARAIAARLEDDDYFRGPSGVAPAPATFLGNHDTGRAAYLIRSQRGAAGDELERRVLLGHSLLYLLRGAPVVYYGDEVGLMGRGGDKAARQDLFPTKVAEWRTEERVGSPPIGTGSSFAVVSHPVGEHLRVLAALRGAHPALATGATIVRSAAQDVLVVSRIDREARREYVAAFNAGGEPARATFRTATPAAVWEPLLGSAAAAASDAEGRLALRLPPLSAVLYRAASGLARRSPAPVTLRAGADELSTLVRVAATVPTLDPVAVTFAVRRAGAEGWRRLASDDDPPFRAFLDPRRYRRGEVVHVVAVVRSSDGSVSTSAVLPVRVRR